MMTFGRLLSLACQECLNGWWGISAFVVLFIAAQEGRPTVPFVLLSVSVILHAWKHLGHYPRGLLHRVLQRMHRNGPQDEVRVADNHRQECIDYVILGELYLLTFMCIVLASVWPSRLAPFVLSPCLICVAIYVYVGRFLEDDGADVVQDEPEESRANDGE